MQREFSLVIKMTTLSVPKSHPSIFEGALNMSHAITCHAVTGHNLVYFRAIYPYYINNNHSSG